ncbi:MAG: alpha-amylase family glycosyl hydrolase [Brevefilum sp.]|nr:alpha-amylase family glycosyl hydrolase [Brevefilum sp.]MDW7754389.1 alpha-amylase family glycosyl hydrolase [Brevefilum sp.]
MGTHRIEDAVFYHIYPLGLCGAPESNALGEPIVHRIKTLIPWLDHIQELGANAIYLGPVFQSSSHGYDTVDYYRVDRRLGDNESLARISDLVHKRGMLLVLDAVFNHVGRDFWAFKDLQKNGQNSAYKDWFHKLRFDQHSPKGDPFSYEGWQEHYDLVKLNLSHPDVRSHLFDAVRMWMDQFRIDGLRLDAADCIDLDFLRDLNRFTKSLNPQFWLMGEVVHGDYCQWVNAETLDSVTNYEAYKGLYSSLNDANYFEIAYGLNRQFGDHGVYQDKVLYNFVDNHDVDRVASKLTHPEHLFPLYLLLFTMPGIPSVYYGSEWGIKGVKGQWSDAPLRPEMDLEMMKHQPPNPDLARTVAKLSRIRQDHAMLMHGNFRQIFVDMEQFVFLRSLECGEVLVALNSSNEEIDLSLDLPWQTGRLRDVLNNNEVFTIENNRVNLKLSPSWGRILDYSNG